MNNCSVQRFSVCFVLLLLLFFTASNTHAQANQEALKLANNFTAALKNTADSAIFVCLPGTDELKQLVEVNNKKNSPALTNSDSILYELKSGLIKNYRQIKTKLTSLHFLLDSVKVQTVELKFLPRELEGIDKANIIVSYSDGMHEFTVQFRHCFYMNHQWYLTDHIVWLAPADR